MNEANNFMQVMCMHQPDTPCYKLHGKLAPCQGCTLYDIRFDNTGCTHETSITASSTEYVPYNKEKGGKK